MRLTEVSVSDWRAVSDLGLPFSNEMRFSIAAAAFH
jgi:hypothetical protein